MDFEIYWTLIGGDIHFANRKTSARQAWEAAKKRQEMSFQQYYAQFGTTEERDGWKMIKPLKPCDPPVHYVKS